MSPSRGLIIWNDQGSLITGFRRETTNVADLHPLLRDEGNEPRPNSRFSVFAFPPGSPWILSLLRLLLNTVRWLAVS